MSPRRRSVGIVVAIILTVSTIFPATAQQRVTPAPGNAAVSVPVPFSDALFVAHVVNSSGYPVPRAYVTLWSYSSPGLPVKLADGYTGSDGTITLAYPAYGTFPLLNLYSANFSLKATIPGAVVVREWSVPYVDAKSHKIYSTVPDSLRSITSRAFLRTFLQACQLMA